MNGQSRLDAMADAETLRRCPWVNSRRRSAVWQALCHAAGNGVSARFQMTTKEKWAPGPDWAGTLGREAARAAFRACPGLR